MSLGRILIALGVLFLTAGVLISLGGRLPLRLGRLPGDIFIQRGNSGFYFPITTCIVVSMLVSAVLWILRRLG